MTIPSCMVPEIWSMKDRIFCGPFLTFYAPNNTKNQNFEKMKNMPPAVDREYFGHW